MRMISLKKILFYAGAILFSAAVHLYAAWALFFFPDDYEMTRREALMSSLEHVSEIVAYSLLDRLGEARFEGDFSLKRISEMARKLMEDSFLVKADSLARGALRERVFRFGTGFPGIWVDERSSLILPPGCAVSFSTYLRVPSRLEFAALAAPSGGAVTLEISSPGRSSLKKVYRLEGYKTPYGPGDVALRWNNRGFEKARADTGWNDLSVDLSDFTGRSIAVRFSREEGEGAVFLAQPRVFCLSPVRRYNVVYILFDGVATRLWSFYNDRSGLTPYMKETAEKEFIVFDNLFSLGDKTRISTSGLFCSEMPFKTRHGINRNIIPARELDMFYESIREDRTALLPDVFRRKGYITQQFGNSGFTVHLLSTGVDYGFERSYEFSYNPYDSYGLSHRFFEFLRENRNREFFVYLHYNTPHKPFYAPAHHYLKGLLRSPMEALWRPDFMGCLSYTDDVFRNLHLALENAGVLENTIVIVATDHGSGYDLSKFDGGFQYNDYTRMTFMMRLPEKLKREIGATGMKRMPAYLSSLNTAPTLTDLTGIGRVSAFEGRSFRPLIRGEMKEGSFDREIWSFGRKAESVITDDGYKYIFTHDEEKRFVSRRYAVIGEEREIPWEQIYNIKDDPHERSNLLLQRRDLLKRFRELYLARDIHHPERTVLTFFPDRIPSRIEVRLAAGSPLTEAGLYSPDMKKAEGLKVERTPGGGVMRFPLDRERRHMVFELKNDRAPLSFEIRNNGKLLPPDRIRLSFLDLKAPGNPVRLRERRDFLVLNAWTLPSAPPRGTAGGLTVKASRVDLHHWIDMGTLEQTGISTGMKETLKSWGYIQ